MPPTKMEKPTTTATTNDDDDEKKKKNRRYRSEYMPARLLSINIICDSFSHI